MKGVTRRVVCSPQIMFVISFYKVLFTLEKNKSHLVTARGTSIVFAERRATMNAFSRKRVGLGKVPPIYPTSPDEGRARRKVAAYLKCLELCVAGARAEFFRVPLA